jgi:glutamate/tyrosine decarboxylase-like PLP-dependent enzyme
MLLLKNKKYLYSDFFIPLPYVLKNKDDFHLGELSLQGTRYPDILKLWLSFQHLGRITYSNLINNSYSITKSIQLEIIKRNHLKLACDPEMNILCFRVEPKNINYNLRNAWNIKLRNFLLKKYNIFFSIAEYKGCNWLRAVILNPFITKRHILKIFKGIDEFNKNEKQNKKIS